MKCVLFANYKRKRNILIYCDYNATTPCAPEVVKAMHQYWSEDFGNPSSAHLAGRIAARAVSNARLQVAELVNCCPGEIYFTSGATESNNLVFLGLLLSPSQNKKRIVISLIEHKSVLEPSLFLEKRGFEVVFLPVSNDGVIDIDKAKKLITADTALVSVQAANNEIGTLQPIKEICSYAHDNGAVFHTDAAQAFGKTDLNFADIGCDLASISSHKIYGPKGIGALFINGGIRQWRWSFPLHGGAHESGLRPGTLNTPAIVGFEVASLLATRNLPSENLFINNLRTYLEKRILERFPNCVIHARKAKRLPGTISVAFPGVPADMLIDNLSSLCVGKGSACSSGTISRSHVLLAIGCEPEVADETIRISLGRYSTIEEMDQIAQMISSAVEVIRH